MGAQTRRLGYTAKASGFERGKAKLVRTPEMGPLTSRSGQAHLRVLPEKRTDARCHEIPKLESGAWGRISGSRPHSRVGCRRCGYC